jgi:hypothetical protein
MRKPWCIGSVWIRLAEISISFDPGVWRTDSLVLVYEMLVVNSMEVFWGADAVVVAVVEYVDILEVR